MYVSRLLPGFFAISLFHHFNVFNVLPLEDPRSRHFREAAVVFFFRIGFQPLTQPLERSCGEIDLFLFQKPPT